MAFWGVLLLAAAGAASAEPEASRAASPAGGSSCIECHEPLDGAALEPVRRRSEDVHFQRGLSCHDCHGGNPDAGHDGDPGAAHDESKGFRGKPERLRIPVFCARCHADPAYMKAFNPQARVDQLGEYRTSVHGKRNAAGDTRVAVCVDCHGVHGIPAVRDPRSPVHPTRVAETCGRCHADPDLMGQNTRQYADYRASVHARALYEKGDASAPTCNDCHGSHGAAPPGVASVTSVCGSCHGREATLFRETEAKRGLDLALCIQCMVCHDNHAVRQPTDEMIGVGPQSTCTTCHAEGDAAYRAAEEMGAALGRLKGRLAEADEMLGRAERAGMEVGADRFALRKARDQLVEARVLAHGFDKERLLAATREGLSSADEGVAAAHRAFRELRRRRIGLSVSLVLIAAVIVSLALKLREIEGRST